MRGRRDDDPLWRSGRREALVALGALAGFGVWTVTVSWFLGYGAPPEEVPLVLGVPRWVLGGVVVPWIAANIFVGWFCFAFAEDGDLGGEGAPPDDDVPAPSPAEAPGERGPDAG